MGGFKKVFLNEKFKEKGISVPSGVSNQPMSDKETFQGALNRANRAKETEPQADYWIGLEGGVEEIDSEMRSVVWTVILSKDQIGKAKTGSFILPPRLSELIKSGIEMGEADDKIFGTSNSKQKNGAVGILTKNAIDRTALYEVGIILALIPFINPEHYPILSKI